MKTIVSFTSLQSYLINPQFQLKYQGPLLKIISFTLGFVFAQAILFEATVPLFVPFYLAFEKYDQAYKKALLVGGVLGTNCY